MCGGWKQNGRKIKVTPWVHSFFLTIPFSILFWINVPSLKTGGVVHDSGNNSKSHGGFEIEFGMVTHVVFYRHEIWSYCMSTVCKMMRILGTRKRRVGDSSMSRRHHVIRHSVANPVWRRSAARRLTFVETAGACRRHSDGRRLFFFPQPP